MDPAACRFSVTVRDAVSPEGDLSSARFQRRSTDKNAEAKSIRIPSTSSFPMQILVSIIIIVLKNIVMSSDDWRHAKSVTHRTFFNPGIRRPIHRDIQSGLQQTHCRFIREAASETSFHFQRSCKPVMPFCTAASRRKVLPLFRTVETWSKEQVPLACSSHKSIF